VGTAKHNSLVTGATAHARHTVSASLQEYDPTAYDLSTMEVWRHSRDGRFDLTVTAPGHRHRHCLATAGLLVTWLTADYGLIDYLRMCSQCTSAADDYTTIGQHPRRGTLQAVASLARPGQIWDSRVRVINVVGWPVRGSMVSKSSIPAPLGIARASALERDRLRADCSRQYDAARHHGRQRIRWHGRQSLHRPGNTWGIDVSWTVTAPMTCITSPCDLCRDRLRGTSFTIW